MGDLYGITVKVCVVSSEGAVGVELGFYMKFSFDNIDPELSLTAPDAFHAYEFDFDPQILTTGPEAFRAYDHSLDETIDYTAHVRAGVT